MKKLNNPVFGIIFVLMLASCSIDYDEALLAEDLSENIPNSVLYNVTHIEVKDGKPLYRIQAAEVASFDKKKEQHLSSVLFQEFNDSGEIITEGWADTVTYFTETEDAEMEGNLDFFSQEEEGGISAEYLYWIKESKNLKSKSENQVNIWEDTGSSITGTGFEADFSTKEIYFSGGTSGTVVDEEDDDEGNE